MRIYNDGMNTPANRIKVDAMLEQLRWINKKFTLTFLPEVNRWRGQFGKTSTHEDTLEDILQWLVSRLDEGE